MPQITTYEGTFHINGQGELTKFEHDKTRWSEGLIHSSIGYKRSMSSLKISDGVKSIGPDVFCGYHVFFALELPDSLTKICTGAFVDTSIPMLTLPLKLTELEPGAFTHCHIGKLYLLENTDYSAELFPQGEMDEVWIYGTCWERFLKRVNKLRRESKLPEWLDFAAMLFERREELPYRENFAYILKKGDFRQRARIASLAALGPGEEAEQVFCELLQQPDPAEEGNYE